LEYARRRVDLCHQRHWGVPLSAKKEISYATRPKGSWVQTERAAHEKWAKLSIAHPRASAVLHVMLAQMGRHNALIASLPNLVRLSTLSRSTVIRAIAVLKAGHWIEVRQIGASGTTNAYIINDRVAWTGAREGIRYSMFSATVVVSDDEQPDRDELGRQPPLTRLPELFPGERQLPTGPGLPPPSEPELTGLETDLPSKSRGEQEVGRIVRRGRTTTPRRRHRVTPTPA
jgi:hypothetical protein